MSTATAKSISPDRNLTAREALTALEDFQCSPECSAAVLVAAIEEFKISLTPPIKDGGKWVAGESSGPLYGFGATALEAVTELLREIRGGNQ
jgi:hypothetical protein